MTYRLLHKFYVQMDRYILMQIVVNISVDTQDTPSTVVFRTLFASFLTGHTGNSYFACDVYFISRVINWSTFQKSSYEWSVRFYVGFIVCSYLLDSCACYRWSPRLKLHHLLNTQIYGDKIVTGKRHYYTEFRYNTF